MHNFDRPQLSAYEGCCVFIGHEYICIESVLKRPKFISRAITLVKIDFVPLMLVIDQWVNKIYLDHIIRSVSYKPV